MGVRRLKLDCLLPIPKTRTSVSDHRQVLAARRLQPPLAARTFGALVFCFARAACCTLVGVIAPVIPKSAITAITAFLLSRKPVIPRVIANEGEE